MQRLYQGIIEQHLADHRQMIFLTGPRQTGKTTISQQVTENLPKHLYLNWDDVAHRQIILSGGEAIFNAFNTDVLSQTERPTIIFDEIHKYRHWKNLLKGIFDVLSNRAKIIVTGSAKLNIYRREGDSLMGRYLLYRVHPLSVGELLGNTPLDSEIVPPQALTEKAWQNLITFGGFPEPYLKANKSFYQRWKNLRHAQLFQEDLRDITGVTDIARLELLAQLLSNYVGSTITYSSLAKHLQITEPTVKQWIDLLREVYYCFKLTPWSKNISRALLKQPKLYLWDWSLLTDPGPRYENLVASHLLKAVNYWTDTGLGDYTLHYLRDKDKREVDFLIIKNAEPWCMVEVKSSGNQRISENLHHFQQQLNVPHVFQVAADLPFATTDCFSATRPVIVSILTFLSQLV